MKYIPPQRAGTARIELALLLCALLLSAQFTFAQNPLINSAPDNALPNDPKVSSHDSVAAELEIVKPQLLGPADVLKEARLLT